MINKFITLIFIISLHITSGKCSNMDFLQYEAVKRYFSLSSIAIKESMEKKEYCSLEAEPDFKEIVLDEYRKNLSQADIIKKFDILFYRSSENAKNFALECLDKFFKGETLTLLEENHLISNFHSINISFRYDIEMRRKEWNDEQASFHSFLKRLSNLPKTKEHLDSMINYMNENPEAYDHLDILMQNSGNDNFCNFIHAW